MFGIGQFFNKFQNAFTKEVVLRTAIKEAIKKHTGADIAIEQIKPKGNTINLGNINSSLKSVIFIKKQRILDELKTIGRDFKDVR